MVKSLLELKAQHMHLDKLIARRAADAHLRRAWAELLELRVKVAKVERELKDSHFSVRRLSSPYALPADAR